jgi:hypothetical protein
MSRTKFVEICYSSATGTWDGPHFPASLIPRMGYRGLLHALDVEAEPHVGRHRLLREERVLLEHDPAVRPQAIRPVRRLFHRGISYHRR